MIKGIRNAMVIREDYAAGTYGYRYFGTKWNSRVSFKYFSGHSQWDYKFYHGYMEIYLGKFTIRLRKK